MELLRSQGWALFKTLIYAFVFCSPLYKNRYPNLHILSMLSLGVSLLSLDILLNLHLWENSRLPWHDFDEWEPMRLSKRHQSGQAPKGENRSVLMDVFPRGAGAPLRCNFSSKWYNGKIIQGRMCNGFSQQRVCRKNKIRSCFTGCQGHIQQRRDMPAKKGLNGVEMKIALIKSSEGPRWTSSTHSLLY